MLMHDAEIRRMALEERMITPFVEKQVGAGIISYGLSSYGYDIRLSDKFVIYRSGELIDPKKNMHSITEEFTSVEYIIEPNGFVLAQSLEEIKVPRDVLVVCVGKSTYARCGLVVNVTPLEPEWKGTITLEISNTTKSPVVIYPFEGIAQLLFFRSDNVCEISYADRKGKYQDQRSVTLPKILKHDELNGL